MKRAERARRKDGAELDAAYQGYRNRALWDLWEMQPKEMLFGRWGTEPDEELIVLEEGKTKQSLTRVGQRFPVAPETRHAIMKAHDWRCLYCGSRADKMHLDHITPLAGGGCTEPANLAPACESCNFSKRAKPLSVWLRSHADLSAIDIIARWEEAKRRGRLEIQ